MQAITLFPQPQQIERKPGAFVLNKHTRVFAADAALGELLAAYLRPATGFGLPTHPLDDDILADATNAILLAPAVSAMEDEAYALDVTPERIVIRASQRNGCLHAIQTLRQLLPRQILKGEPQADVAWAIPALRVSDAPAFGWRGLHLDSGRHLFPVDFNKKFIDAMAAGDQKVSPPNRDRIAAGGDADTSQSETGRRTALRRLLHAS